MTNINIVAIVESVEKSHSHYDEAIKTLAIKSPFFKEFTAKEIGLEGATLSWLATYGVLKVVGKKEEFILIDSWDDTYKKVNVNVYAFNCDIIDLADHFAEKQKEVKVQKIEKRIAILNAQLKDAIDALNEIQ